MENFSKFVYVASPFAGDVEENVRKTKEYCKFVADEGMVPLAPHLHYPQFLDDDNPQEREIGLMFSLSLLSKCDELWVFGRISKGVRGEIDTAERIGMPIRYFLDQTEDN